MSDSVTYPFIYLDLFYPETKFRVKKINILLTIHVTKQTQLMQQNAKSFIELYIKQEKTNHTQWDKDSWNFAIENIKNFKLRKFLSEYSQFLFRVLASLHKFQLVRVINSAIADNMRKKVMSTTFF